MWYHAQNLVKLPRGSSKWHKNVFFVRVRIRGYFSVTYVAQISSVFEITDVNQCVGGDRRENFQISAQGVLQTPKMHFWVGTCMESTGQMPKFWATRLISGSSHHPNNVPVVDAFCRWMYGLGN